MTQHFRRSRLLTTVCGAVGGVMGYKKKRSKDSLIASSIIAGLLLTSAYLMGRPDTTYGVRLALGDPHILHNAATPA